MDLKIDILTSRKYEKRPWFDLVYEWEDEIKELLNCKLIYEPTIYFTGRFADWEYYNMDIAMRMAMDLCKKI